MKTATAHFQASVLFSEDTIEALTVFVYELSPKEQLKERSACEWVEEFLREWDYAAWREAIPDLAEEFSPAQEVVCKGSITGDHIDTNYGEDYDEELIIAEYLYQRLPDDWFAAYP